MITDPLVSIIIPCYNAGPFLEEALGSVAAQSYPLYEIIIIDDGSTDPYTLEVLNKLYGTERHIIQHQENQGPGIARNKAAEASHGEFLVMLDADNKIRKDTISRALPVLGKDPGIGVVYGNYEYFGLKTGLHKQDDFNIRKQLVTNQIEMASVIRKKAFLDVGGFDPFNSLNGFNEDYELWLSLYEAGWAFHYVDETFFDYRVTPNSRTAEKFHEYKIAVDHIYEKHSDLLSSEFIKLYHENKNLKRTLDYRIGNSLLGPLRRIKKIIKK
jgi:glycosyltransferase involved in cell wall biosynthesis